MIPWGYALIGDVVASRQERDRAALGGRIEQALTLVNTRYAGEWIAPVVTTRGLDEVSSVLRRPRHAFDVVTTLNVVLWPARFRFALAGGAIDVGEVGDVAADLDGPAFHRAADALARAREEHRPMALGADLLDAAVARVAEETMRLHHAHLRTATPRGMEIARRVRAVDGAGTSPTQREVAAALDISPAAISQALTRGHHGDLVAAEDAIRELLAGVDPEAQAEKGAEDAM